MKIAALVLAFIATLFAGTSQVEAQRPISSIGGKIDVLVKRAPSGAAYVFYFSNNCSAEFSNKRPDLGDKKVLLCIPAAFTTSYDNIDGVFVCQGKIGNAGQVNRRIGGALLIQDGAGRIFPTNGGALLNDDFVNHAAAKKSSLFQQFQVVLNGHGERFSDKSACQRRGIATFSDGRLAVLESTDPVSLTEFGVDAASMGVQDLLYTDMGPWSEGWYRDAKGKPIVIGQSRTLTHKQTNWFFLRSKS